MITEVKRRKIGNQRRVSEFVGLSTDTKPCYQICDPQPTKAQFESNETHYFTYSNGSYEKCVDGAAYGTIKGVATGLFSFEFNSATFLSKVSNELGDYVFKATVTTTPADATRTVTAQTGSGLAEATCTFTKETFLSKTTETTEFVYDGTNTKWLIGETEATLSEYGLAIAPETTLVDGDKIKVTVTPESSSTTWKDEEGTTVTISQYGVTNISGVLDGSILTLICYYDNDKTYYECIPMNGSTFHEINTKKDFMFNEDGEAGSQWVEQ